MLQASWWAVLTGWTSSTAVAAMVPGFQPVTTICSWSGVATCANTTHELVELCSYLANVDLVVDKVLGEDVVSGLAWTCLLVVMALGWALSLGEQAADKEYVKAVFHALPLVKISFAVAEFAAKGCLFFTFGSRFVLAVMVLKAVRKNKVARTGGLLFAIRALSVATLAAEEMVEEVPAASGWMNWIWD
jgi:hypothetical protein